MALRSIQYTTSTRLCVQASDLPLDIVICVPSTFTAARSCTPLDSVSEETFQTYNYSYIDGQITAAARCKVGCGTAFRYTLTFDDDQLDPGQNFNSSSIQGIFTKGCLTQWVEDQAGDEITLISNEDGSLTLTTQHGCQYTFFPGSS